MTETPEEEAKNDFIEMGIQSRAEIQAERNTPEKGAEMDTMEIEAKNDFIEKGHSLEADQEAVGEIEKEAVSLS